MTKLKLQISLLILVFMNAFILMAQDNYTLSLHGVDKDSSFLKNEMGVLTRFPSRNECVDYVNKLPSYLQARGYATVSIDSVRFDSSSARIAIFTGDRYQWAQLDTRHVDPHVLQALGWREKIFTDKPMDFKEVAEWQEKMLGYMEDNGHPFARVYLDSLQLDSEKVWAQLRLDKGPFYKIDSIRVYGNAKISNEYLQRYLDIRNGTMFSKQKLLRINKKIRELAYVEEEYPSKLLWLNTGSVLELYLKQKKSSQINLLVGFLPNNDQLSSKKILITGEANINLKNSLGSGETIGVNWQQLQVKSPRLNLIYQHPYLFNTPIGLDFAFDMFHKDSTFLNINFQLGAQYTLDINQSGKLFLQRSQTIVSAVNTAFLLQNKRFPDEADVSSVNVGVDYEFNNTNYRLNPTRGNEFRLIGTVGTKKIKKNNQILELKDPGDPSFDFGSLYDTVKLKTYQFRLRAIAARYLPLGKQHRTTLKLGFNGGIFQSGNIFRNELFQIGGYKLLRGFDEESQYLSQYAVGTVEYRILAGQQNSYFYVFSDGGWGRNNSQNADVSYTYISGGAGLAFETNVGIFNLAWAVGKRSDVEFNLRQSKIHFGFVNYF
jgi:outer membrane protein assembly factor BamA